MTETRRRRRSLFDLPSEHVEDIETLTEEFAGAETERPSWDTKACCIEALCNVSVEVDEVVVTADLPNTNPDTIKIEQINRDILEIKAEMKRRVRFDEFGITHRKGEFRFFRCQMHIPVSFDAKKMTTRFKRGILEVRLPRKRRTKP